MFTVLQIEFESHPAPHSSNVTWHLGDITINPSDEEDEATEDEDEVTPQFVAHPLEFGDDDLVTAKLTVNYLSLEVCIVTFIHYV